MPTGRSSEGGPARSTLLLLGPRRSRKSRGRVARRIPEGIPGNEPSDPKSARPSPRGLCASAVSVKPLGSRERYTCYLQRFNPSFVIASRRQPDPQNVWARSDLRGKRLKPSRRHDLCEPGPGVWPLRLAKRQRGGERTPQPRPKLIVGRRRDKFKVRQPTSGSISRPRPTRRRTITYRPVRRRLRATHLKSGLHFPSPLEASGLRSRVRLPWLPADQRSRLAELALRPEPRPKALRGADALRHARRMSLGEQSSTCRASTLHWLSGLDPDAVPVVDRWSLFRASAAHQRLEVVVRPEIVCVSLCV